MTDQSIWLPTSNDLRRQCTSKLLEAEKDYWLTTNEMLHGMLESIWDAAKKGEASVLDFVLNRCGDKLQISKSAGKGRIRCHSNLWYEFDYRG